MQQEACTKFCVLRHSETCVTFRLSIHMYIGLWNFGIYALLKSIFMVLLSRRVGHLNDWELRLLKGVFLGNWSYLNHLLKIEVESVLILSSALVL